MYDVRKYLTWRALGDILKVCSRVQERSSGSDHNEGKFDPLQSLLLYQPNENKLVSREDGEYCWSLPCWS